MLSFGEPSDAFVWLLLFSKCFLISNILYVFTTIIFWLCLDLKSKNAGVGGVARRAAIVSPGRARGFLGSFE